MSKKRVLKFVYFLLIIAVSACAMSACTFIRKNDERIANHTIATVTNGNGLQTTINRMEILDYYNTYAYYLINYNGMTAAEAMDWAVENKVKSKYLVLEGIDYLKTVPARQGKMFGTEYKTAESVLTLAERYAAIYSVNSSMQSTLDGYVDTAKQSSLTAALSKISHEDVKEIVFADDTVKYLKEEYYVGETLDADRVKIVVVYENESRSNALVVPTSAYDTAFSSEKAGDAALKVKFDKKIVKDGKTSYETIYAEHEYTVVEPRATKNKPAEETEPDDIKIGDYTVNRYDSEEKIKEIMGDAFDKLKLMDIKKIYEEMKNDVNADADLTDAYRQLSETLDKSYRTMPYYYNNAYESAVTNALQAEVYKEAAAVTEAEIIEQFKYLYATGKNSYDGVLPEDYASTFASAIKSNMETLYYYPAIENIDGFFYVYQILFNFSEKQKSFLESATGDNKELAKEYYEQMKGQITTKESNPNYDKDFHCPLHEKKENGATCKWLKENPDSTELCPSIPYVLGEDGKAKERLFTEVFAELEAELKAIYQSGKSDAEIEKESFDLFESYMYRFNDDGGIMNSSSGYLIAPQDMKDPNGFYQQFLDLAYEVQDGGDRVGNAFNNQGKLAYAFTPYGVHLICISSKPFGEADRAGLDLTGDEKILAYLQKPYNLAGDTLYKKIQDSLANEKKTQKYSAFTTEKVPEKLMEDGTKVSVDEKKKDKMISDYVG